MGRSSATPPSAAGPATATATATGRAEPPPKESYRDTVEAIVVAFILALVVRGFEAQAFVIPTGSMAPTLMGRHKEVACPQCGFVYAVNASGEVESSASPNHDVDAGVCVNCRFLDRSLAEQPSFKGDRILVMMFPYDLPFLPGSRGPERWDVVVFRYPEDPEVSYIKRLVGLPGETIRIAHGDVYVRAPGQDRFELARKPWKHQSSMQITVYDDRYRARALDDRPEWARWRGESGWKAAPSESRYRAEGGAEWSELRYSHLVPDREQWEAILEGREPRAPRPTLVTDFYSYNTNIPNPIDRLAPWMQSDWVGDLALQSDLDIREVKPGGSVRWELIEGGVPHRCTVDLSTGEATFTRGDEVLGRAPTPIKGTGRHRVEFANVDDRLTLVVDGRPAGGPGFAYEVGEADPVPTGADLAPAAMAVRDATVEAADLVLKRDIYYTQEPGKHDYELAWNDRSPSGPEELFDLLGDPSRFSKMTRPGRRDFEIGADRFFMMGDNSPCSSDSRRWENRDLSWDPSGSRKRFEVPRQFLTGKAFFIYWPHGVPVWPGIAWGRDFRFPFRPYLERMKWIR